MGRSPLRVLSGASLSVAAAEFLVVMGASGSGKSTLLHLLGALDVPDSGTVGFRGRNLFSGGDDDRRLYRNKEVGFVFQFYHLLPECNVLENVLMPMMVGRSVWQWLADRKQARRDAEEILDRVGLADRLKHRPRELSGGERQRVAIARALVSRPALLLADEPTGNLDKATGLGVMKLLGELNRAGQTIVLVTHDHEVAARAHRCVQLTDGVLRDAAAETMPPQIATRTPRKEVAP
jgi:ABC-type lipoprotein export system ATPase subunit